ncbi:MAG: lipocalin family protein [Arachnia sp.]
MTNDDTPQVTAVEDLDLQRYLGLWFEVGRLPLRFEDDGARDVTAQYSLKDDGTIEVDNRCINEKGEPTQALGQAVPGDERPSELRVTFLPAALRWIPFTQADYWVLKVDADYLHALVGTPDHKHLWLLARDPRITPETEAEFLAEAQRQGFDLTPWIRPEHSGGRVTDDQVDD